MDEWRWWRFTRDVTLFLAGLAGIGYETLAVKGDRPELLILFGGMVGLPPFLRADEFRRYQRSSKRPSKDGP